MRVEVFDDNFSLIHFLLGLAMALIGNRTFAVVCFMLYITVEIIEHFYKYPNETHEQFLGDIIELIFGIGFGYMVRLSYGW